MHKRFGVRHALPGEAIVGRSSRSDLVIPDNFVSGLHAMVRWSGTRWELKDLGSHNGTAVNGHVVPPGTLRQLQRGDEITFGQAEATWVLTDDAPPEPLAIDREGARASGENGLLVLPSEEDPIATIYFAAVGRWRIETGDGVSDARDGDEIKVEGTQWTLRLPEQIVRTRTARGTRTLQLGEVEIVVRESPEGTVWVETGDADELQSFAVGSPGRLLGRLARARRAANEGWVERETLLDDLSMRADHLNVAVYRLRRRFADAGFVDAVNIVDRDGSRLRLGTKRVRLGGLSSDRDA